MRMFALPRYERTASRAIARPTIGTQSSYRKADTSRGIAIYEISKIRTLRLQPFPGALLRGAHIRKLENFHRHTRLNPKP
jgi:hypothetical protein